MQLLGYVRSHLHSCCRIASAHLMPRRVMDNPPPCGYYACMIASASVLGERDRLSHHAQTGVQQACEAMWRGAMGISRVLTGSDGESHMEEVRLEEHPALGALTNIQEVRVQQFDGTRKMDFPPLPERRLIMHLSGGVEIGTSDGSRHVFRAGDMRLMEDVTGRGHTHVDCSPSSAVYIPLKDEDGGAHTQKD
jgi:hypothetical protein